MPDNSICILKCETNSKFDTQEAIFYQITNTFCVISDTFECQSKVNDLLEEFKADLLVNMASADHTVDEYMMHFTAVYNRMHSGMRLRQLQTQSGTTTMI